VFTWLTVIYNRIIRWIVKHVSYQLTFVVIISSFYSLWSVGHPWRASKHCNLIYPLDLIPWSSCIFLFHPLLSFTTFSLAYLFFYIPEDSNPMQFSLLLLLLYVMCPIQFHFLLFIWISIGFCLVILYGSSFVMLSVHFIFIICLKHLFINVCNTR